MPKPKKLPFDHSRESCHLHPGEPCKFPSDKEEDPSVETAERLAATRESRREQVRKYRRGIN
jgi:hypothetical protein